MSTFYIAQFDNMPNAANSAVVMAPHYPPLNEQTLTISGSSAQSTPMVIGARYAQLSTDAVCSFAVGVNPVATTANSRMAANETRFIGVDPGQIIAVISNT